MGRFGLFILTAFAGTSALAAEWQPMTGPEITATLTDHIVDYGRGAWQDFRASGRTQYHSGRPSWGYWAVRGDQYCSQWPPSDLWACYDMERGQGGAIRWIGAAGDVTPATIRGPLE